MSRSRGRKPTQLAQLNTDGKENLIFFFGGPEKIDGEKNPNREIGEVIIAKMQYTRTCISGMVQ